MSHVAGIGPILARSMGFPDSVPPHILCDGCGKTHPVTLGGGIPAEWEIQGSPPPRWTGKRIYKDGEIKDGEIKREDFCVACSFAQL